MLTIWGAITAFAFYGAVPTVGGLWTFERWRARKRNRRGECATCGEAWQSRPSPERYLVHGRLVCEPCAERARRRIPWQVGAVGVASASAGIVVAMTGGSAVMVAVVPIGVPLGMTAGVIYWMKRANREAQRRIANGEYPDLADRVMVRSSPAPHPATRPEP